MPTRNLLKQSIYINLKGMDLDDPPAKLPSPASGRGVGGEGTL